MYQPYDPFAYQAYNDPKPDHYASAIPSGFQPPTATPSHPPKQEPPKKEERHASHSVPKREEKKKDSGASEDAKLMVKQLKEANASLKLQLTNSKESADKALHEKDTLIANLRREIDASRSQAGVGQREAAAAVERDWVQRLSSNEQAHQQLLASVRREAEANTQRLFTKQQESQQLLAQARRDADANAQKLSSKEQEYQQLLAQALRDAEANAQKFSSKEQENQQLLAQARRDADASAQRLSSKEQENEQLLAQNRDLVDQTETNAAAVAQLKREWAARLSKTEQENSLLLVRFTQLQSDTETGRACLLETNAAQEERISKLRDEAKQHEAEVVELRDKTRSQEAELMKLRDETSKLLDELTIMVEEKDIAFQSAKESEHKKRELEERVRELKAVSAEFMAEINAINLEKKKLLRNIAAVEKELDECRTLCEKGRLRIEELDNEQLPTLNSQIELMTRLDERAQGKVAELEDRLAKVASMLEASRHARDSLEHQLDEAEKREMENHRENRARGEELERVKLELERHQRDHAKYFAAVESEKGEALGRVSALEKSLHDVTEMRDHLQEDCEIAVAALDREVQEGVNAKVEYKLGLEKLEERIATLTSTKNALEARVAESESQRLETETSHEDVVAKHKTDAHTLRSNIEKLEAQLSTSRSAHSGHVAELKVLNEELESYKAEIQSLRSHVAGLESQKTDVELLMHAMVKASNEEMEEHKRDAETLRSHIETLEVQVSVLLVAKRTLEAPVAESETKQVDGMHAAVAAQETSNALKDEKRSLMDTETAALLEQVLELQGLVKCLEEEKAELLVKLDKVIGRHEETLAHHEDELLNKRRIEREVKMLRLELSKVEALEAEIGSLTKKLHDANERAKDLEDDRSYSEARSVAYLEDNKAVAVRASALGTELCEKETEYKRLNDRFLEINGKYMDVVAEREELTQTLKNLRK